MVARTISLSAAILVVLVAVNYYMITHRESKKVWMTLLTNEKYLTGALTLEYSLRKFGSKYPMVVFHPDTLEQSALDALKKRKIQTKLVKLLLPTTHKDYGTDDRFYDCWSKLLPHGMIEYERIVEFDSDMLVRDNVDELMEMPLPNGFMAATHACVCNPKRYAHYPADWVPENCAYTQQHSNPDGAHLMDQAVDANFGTGILNGGMQVITPNRKRFNDIVQILSNATLTQDFAFADQSVLSYYFKDKWVPLPYAYNALKTMREAHAPMWRDEHAKVVHYILNDKPWNDPLEERSEFLPHVWWWQINQERVMAERMEEVKKTTDRLIIESRVVVFSKSYCPHCRAAKAALKEHGTPFEVVELDQVADGSLIQRYLSTRKGGVRTVPQVFVRGKFIGGNSDLQRIKAEPLGFKKLFI